MVLAVSKCISILKMIFHYCTIVFFLVSVTIIPESLELKHGHTRLSTIFSTSESEVKGGSESLEYPANYIRNKDGSCTSCPSGFQGKDCSEPCPDNYYGYNCLLPCYCTAVQVCHKRRGCTEINAVVSDISTERTSEGMNTTNTNNIGPVSGANYQVYLMYINGGLVLVLIITIGGTIVVKRTKTRTRRTAFRGPTIEEISEVPVHNITGVRYSSNQETLYSNVYLEIIDLENGSPSPCFDQGKVSKCVSSTSQSIEDFGYLDVIASVEKGSDPIDTLFSSDSQNSGNIQIDEFQIINLDTEEKLSESLSAGI